MDPRNERRTATRILIAAGLLPHLPDDVPAPQPGPLTSPPQPPGPVAPTATQPETLFPSPRLDQVA
jgi:hypothetical protein